MERKNNILNKIWRVTFFEKLSKTISNFTISEKVFFYILCIVFVASGLKMLNNVNRLFIVDVPANGGYLLEGIIGSPRFINPVLAVSDADHDLTALVYSGLLKVGPDNSLLPDLAKSYTVSDDAMTYTFTMKDTIYFHDGTKVTADDVLFTIQKIQDSAIKSPKRPAFYDVDVKKVGDNQIQFVLKKPYSPFIQNLTVGILPKHLWNSATSDQFPLSQYNIQPVGSGPYKINTMQTVTKDMFLIPTSYELTPFSQYTFGKPFIDTLTIHFYSDEKSLIDAYNNGDIEAMNSISPDSIPLIKDRKGTLIKTSPLPRTFSVFFNQNQSEALANKEVRQALNVALNRQKIVDEVLNGYGTPIYGPIPAGIIKNVPTTDMYNPDQAQSILTKAGWAKNKTTGIMEKKVSKTKTIQLEISISTLNSPDLVKAANMIKTDWESIGARVDIKEFEFGDLQQNVIRPRKFDALLYGIVTGRDMDFFAFWHSSQRNDPGLNISMYANSKVDKLLEDARKTLDPQKRMQDYSAFQDEVEKDSPAVFVYSPQFIYIVPDKIKNLNLGVITLPYERFLNINNWYIETNNLWKVFVH